MKQRDNFPTVCADSLRTNFMVIGAASLNSFTTTVIGCLFCCAAVCWSSNVNMSNGLVQAMLAFPCVVYHRLRGSRTL